MIKLMEGDFWWSFKRNSSQKKVGQATCIAPLQPLTLATFPSWGIQRELVVQDLPQRKNSKLIRFSKLIFWIFKNYLISQCFLYYLINWFSIFIKAQNFL